MINALGIEQSWPQGLFLALVRIAKILAPAVVFAFFSTNAKTQGFIDSLKEHLKNISRVRKLEEIAPFSPEIPKIESEIIQSSDPKLLDLMFPLLNDWKLQCLALRVIEAHPEPRALDPLLSALGAASFPRSFGPALNAIRSPEKIQRLWHLFYSGDVSVRSHLAAALERVAGPEIDSMLLLFLSDPEESVADSALESVERRKMQFPFETLHAFVKYPSYQVRWYALVQMKDQRDPFYEAYLVQYRIDNDLNSGEVNFVQTALSQMDSPLSLLTSDPSVSETDTSHLETALRRNSIGLIFYLLHPSVNVEMKLAVVAHLREANPRISEKQVEDQLEEISNHLDFDEAVRKTAEAALKSVRARKNSSAVEEVNWDLQAYRDSFDDLVDPDWHHRRDAERFLRTVYETRLSFFAALKQKRDRAEVPQLHVSIERILSNAKFPFLELIEPVTSR